MRIRLAYVFVLMVIRMLPSSSVMAQQTVSGRIIMYDWMLHELTNSDEFIFRASISSKGKPQFIRVIYRVNWGFDAPASPMARKLDRLAFVGRGASWEVVLHTPDTEDQKRACVAPIVPHRYQDEEGSGIFPRYVPTPGGQTLDEASVSKMPCRILLKQDDIQRLK